MRTNDILVPNVDCHPQCKTPLISIPRTLWRTTLSYAHTVVSASANGPCRSSYLQIVKHDNHDSHAPCTWTSGGSWGCVHSLYSQDSRLHPYTSTQLHSFYQLNSAGRRLFFSIHSFIFVVLHLSISCLDHSIRVTFCTPCCFNYVLFFSCYPP